MANIRIRNQGKITLKDSDNSNSVSLQTPSTVSANQDFIVPNADGSANNIITTNASGTLSFTDIDNLIASDINWNTTPQYANITLVSGTGYFINTTSGPTTMTLPASPSVGDFVALKDYAGTFGTNKLTIDRNGSNIQGLAANSDLTTDRASVVLVYVDATKGWLYTVENNVGSLQPPYVTATGGTITTDGDYKIHTFTSSGTFTVNYAGASGGSNTVDYLVVAGGGAGGGHDNYAAGGGGAGGMRYSFPNPATGGFPVSAQAYPITVGAGGTHPGNQNYVGGNGANSVFSTITSAGGGGGGGYLIGPSSNFPLYQANDGGSGGGAANTQSFGATNTCVGSGNTPPVSPSQGNNGGTSKGNPIFLSGGGGGHGAVGANAPCSSGPAGAGGAGTPLSITGSGVTYSGGGGGGASNSGSNAVGAGGAGGGGAGGGGPSNLATTAGTANTGGGGGGGGCAPTANSTGASGGSGVVIIRYKYQN